MKCAYSYTFDHPSNSETVRVGLLQVRRWVSRTFVAALLTIPVLASPVMSAELIVVDQANCPYCERFDQEIAPAWPKTDEGRDVPLRRVNMHAEWPSDLSAVDPATLTPTFILVEDGAEMGRLVGYAGDEHFWFLIGQVLENVSAQGSTED